MECPCAEMKKNHFCLPNTKNKKICLICFLFCWMLLPSLFAATFAVNSRSGGTGSGSLYAAIVGVNHSSSGANTISFTVNGTISLSTPLPSISNNVTIDGFSAPGWSGNPVVTINFNKYAGFIFETNATGSCVEGLSLVNASNAAINLYSSSNTISKNFIGLLANGTSALGNQGDGIFLAPTSTQNIIGSTNTNPSTFALENVISGNANNGIYLSGSSGNQITMNYIGTDVTGLIDIGNSNSGVLVANNANNNVIGGAAYGSNNPTKKIFQRPPQGNLISANKANGVAILNGSSSNIFEGNYIGTDTTGNNALGNTLNGVLIEGANNNSLLGCFFTNNAFAFYNVISGNLKNGIKVTNANETTIQGNFIGIGSSNDVIVSNLNDGVLVAGTSSHTQLGGVIPLGNVISGNQVNGTEIKDTVSYCTNFNTFGGVFAFGGVAPNDEGILYSSTGSNNLIRTCIISGNNKNGIHVTGDATGLTITDTGCGVSTALIFPVPNGQNGLLVDENANNINIGIDLSSIEPRNTFSGNLQYGIAFEGNAHGNFIYNSFIGDAGERVDTGVGNGMGGILLGPGTFNNTIGADPSINTNYLTAIGFNFGSGISLNSSVSNTIAFCHIIENAAYGIIAYGDCSGTILSNNIITGNVLGSYYLLHSLGIRIAPSK